MYKVGDLVWVPFPFVEAPRLRRRPALVVSRPWQADGVRLYWTAMITSRENAGWTDDIDLGPGFAQMGLTVPCVIRPAKVASVMEEQAQRLGRLPEPLLARVLATTGLVGS